MKSPNEFTDCKISLKYTLFNKNSFIRVPRFKNVEIYEFVQERAKKEMFLSIKRNSWWK